MAYYLMNYSMMKLIFFCKLLDGFKKQLKLQVIILNKNSLHSCMILKMPL